MTKGDGTTLLASYDYHVRSDGLRDYVDEKRLIDSSSTAETNFSKVRITWDYDGLGRLTEEKRDEDKDDVLNGNDYTADYTYDLAGNRATQTIVRADPAESETISYDYADADDTLVNYNADDRLFVVMDAKGAGTPTASTTVTRYHYDPNGSTDEKTVTTTPTDGTPATTTVVKYVYDARNRLVRLDANGDTQYDANGDPLSASSTNNVDTAADDTTYAYDDDGDRVSQTTGGQTTTYVVDKQNPTGYSQVVEEHAGNAAAPAVSYVVGADVIGQVKQSADSAATVQYLLYDGHGSTRELLGADGTPVFDAATNKYVLMDYDAFGNQVGFNMAAAAINLTKFLYSGEQYDSGLGQQYLRARYYDQTVGRFSSYDSYEGQMGVPTSLQKYVFAANNPIALYDPSGHMPNLTTVLIGIAVIATMSALLYTAYQHSRSPDPYYRKGGELDVPDERYSGVFSFKAIRLSETGLDWRFGWDMEYMPAVKPKPGQRIVLVQAIQSVGGINGTDPGIDFGGQVAKTVETYLNANAKPGGIKPPGYVETGGKGNQLLITDAPGGDGASRHLVTAVAILRTTSNTMAPEDGTDIILGAVNFEYDSVTGVTRLSGSDSIGPENKGPIFVLPQAPGVIWTRALERWHGSSKGR